MPTIFDFLKKIKLHRVIIGVGVFIIFAQYVWKFLYIQGVVPGAYWLFITLDKWYLESIKYTFVLAGFVLIIWIMSLFLIKKISAQLVKVFCALIFMGFAIIITFPVTVARNTVFVDKVQVKNKVYYLTAFPMFAEVNYSVSKCEFTGQFCQTIFVSGDITRTNWQLSSLKYDESKQELMVIEHEQGLIYSEEVP